MTHTPPSCSAPPGRGDHGRPVSGPAAHRFLAPLFAAARPAFRALVADAERFRDGLGRIRAQDPGLAGERPARFEQVWFPRLDGLAAYTTVRAHRPARILEIGCGHSTRFMAQAIVDGGLATAFTCVDPRPRAPIAGLPLTHAVRAFGDAEVELVARFAANDILFVDSSHVGAPGGEVERVVLDVLPQLPPGALVHFHDIFLPDAYPAAWEPRRYTEQTVVGALLQGGGYDILWASRYVATRTDLLDQTFIAELPLASDALEASLWLRKTAAALRP